MHINQTIDQRLPMKIIFGDLIASPSPSDQIQLKIHPWSVWDCHTVLFPHFNQSNQSINRLFINQYSEQQTMCRFNAYQSNNRPKTPYRNHFWWSNRFSVTVWPNPTENSPVKCLGLPYSAFSSFQSINRPLINQYSEQQTMCRFNAYQSNNRPKTPYRNHFWWSNRFSVTVWPNPTENSPVKCLGLPYSAFSSFFFWINASV